MKFSSRHHLGIALPTVLFACGAPSAPRAAVGDIAAASPSDAGVSAVSTASNELALDDGGLLVDPASRSGASNEPEGHAPFEPGRSGSEIGAVVRAHRTQARACYDLGRLDNPSLSGNLVMRWVIDPKGKPSQVVVDMSLSSIQDEHVIACVAQVIGALTFAPSAKGFETHASYPFNFRPHLVGK